MIAYTLEHMRTHKKWHLKLQYTSQIHMLHIYIYIYVLVPQPSSVPFPSLEPKMAKKINFYRRKGNMFEACPFKSRE